MKKQNKTIICAVALTLNLAVAVPVNAFAETADVQHVSEWLEDGISVKTEQKTGFQEIDGKIYYFDSETGEMLTGRRIINGKKYYFAEDGSMQFGFQDIDGNRYYFNEEGQMIFDFQEIDGKIYYFDNSGIMLTGRRIINGKRYYFAGDGSMQFGFQDIDGDRYYFDEEGQMVFGWREINGEKYYFNSKNGKMAKNKVIMNLPENSTADVLVTVTSPDATDELYYKSVVDSESSGFYIEGIENAESDYRKYKISIEITGGEYNITSSVFADEINVPYIAGDSDSNFEYVYNFTIDGEKTGKDWDITSEDTARKDVALHLNAVTMGDIDGNGIVDAKDASGILAEYSLLSTGSATNFNSRQKLQADVNNDGIINANDASKILAYYSANSTGGSVSWDEI